MSSRRAPTRALTPEDRAIAGLPAEPGPPPAPDPDTQWKDVRVPKTREEFAEVLARGAARALELASDAKALTDALKAANEVFKTLYPEPEDEGSGYGSGLPKPESVQNGAHA